MAGPQDLCARLRLQLQEQQAPSSSLQHGEELHHLLASGVACLRLGISIIEVVQCMHEACAAANQPPHPPEPWPQHAQQQQQHAPPRHSKSDPLNSFTCGLSGLAAHGGLGTALLDDDDSGSMDGATGAGVLCKRLGRVLYANAALEEMTGLRLHELQDQGLGAMFGPATSHADIGALHAALHAPTPSTVKVLCYRRNNGGGANSSGAADAAASGTTVSNAAIAGGASIASAAAPAGPSSLPSATALAVAGCIWSSVTVTPISQLPFTCTLWVPPHGSETGGSTATPSAEAPRRDSMLGLPAGLLGGCCGGGGCVVQYLCVHEDITERVTQCMQWRLRDHALSSCSEGITIADPSQPDAPLVYVNDAFLQITGYTREDVIGRNCRFLQGADTSRDAVATLKAAVAARRKATVELLNYKKSGEAFWNRLSITPVFNDAGELVSYIGVQSDVTELIRRKEEEQRLMEAKVAAETATEAKSMFLANMSHEIRTPLNGMMATAQLLLASALTPEQRELAETILESGNSLLGILGDILDFSKLDHGSVVLTREPMCLRRSIEACIEIVAPDATKKGLVLYYTSDEQALALPLLGDAIRLRQVLTNLLSNAVKFTKRGEVHVDVQVESLPPQQACCCPPGQPHVTCNEALQQQQREKERHQQALKLPKVGSSTVLAPATSAVAPPLPLPQQQGCQQAGRRIRISVTDTGIGIPANLIGSLFQCFKQGSESMARRYGGTGLGLAISKRLSELMQGTVWVESEGRHKGCTFHFCIPADFHLGGPLPVAPTNSASSNTLQGTAADPSSLPPLPGAVHTAAAATAQPGRAEAPVSEPPTPPPPPLPSEDADAWSGVMPPLAASSLGGQSDGGGLAASYGSSTGSSSGAALLGAAVGGGGSGLLGGPGHFSHALSAEDLLALEGRLVLVDVGHPGLALQVSQSCRQLGMLPSTGDSTSTFAIALSPGSAAAMVASSGAAMPAGPTSASASHAMVASGSASTDGTTSAPHAPPAQVLVVSTARAAQALKSGWKGRPVVAVGSRELLTPNLHPLVVLVPQPVLHARLVNALVKSMVLLKWAPGARGSAGPKLTHQPISPAQIADFKQWRDRSSSNHHHQVATTLLAAQAVAVAQQHHHHANGSSALGGALVPGPGGGASAALLVGAGVDGAGGDALGLGGVLALRGLYVGGQLAVTQAQQQQAQQQQQEQQQAQQQAQLGSGGAGGMLLLGGVDGIGGMAGEGFSGGFARGGYANYSDAMTRRSSLDNSSLDRALVRQMMLARANGGHAEGARGGGGGGAASGAAVGGGSAGAGGTGASSPWNRVSAGPGMNLPRAIPENGELQSWDGEDSSGGRSSTAPAAPAGLPVSEPGAPATALAAPLQQLLGHMGQRVGSGGGGGGAGPAANGAVLVAPGQAEAPAAAAAAASLPPLRILIAEDNKVNQKVVLKVLQQISGGAQTDVVENGLQVLDALKHKSYDIILMDIHMPYMDGLEATRHIVATYPPLVRPRIIALSADTLQALHDRCREAGIEEFIVKPFRVEDLKRVMQTCAPRSSRPHGAPGPGPRVGVPGNDEQGISGAAGATVMAS